MSVFNRIMNKIFPASHTDIGGQSKDLDAIKGPPSDHDPVDVDGILTEAGLKKPEQRPVDSRG
jgi:hypothetical protein